MYRKILIIWLLALIILPSALYSANRLLIRDPQSWRYGTGTIEDATISIKPKGIYMEVGLYLTISSKGLNFYGQDQLEVELDFTLPEGVIVKDSWLWVGEDIIRAEIMDKWTASSIYEDIVNRRRDPSILFKYSDTQYELRIYPLSPTQPRKVKITYLVPTQWSGTETIIPLPNNILNLSLYPLDNFQLITWPKDNWQNPKLIEFPDISFEKRTDPKSGDFLFAELPLTNSLNFAVDAPYKHGIYISTFSDKNESYYQMAFLPSEALNINSAKKVAILVDFDAYRTSLDPADLLYLIKSMLHSYFDDDDYFNLIFSQLSIHRISDKWISAHPDTIDHIFASLDENVISSYSNLPSLLGNGIEFVKQNGNDGSLLLLSSSDQAGSYEVANQMIDDILDLMDPTLQIHIGDLQDYHFSYNWIGGRTYYGNEYLYKNLTRLTTANLQRKIDIPTFSQVLNSVFQGLGGFLPILEIYTKLEGGICYGRFNLGTLSGSTYLNQPVLQVGKFDGDPPFIIEASGIYNDEIFTQNFEIDQSGIVIEDSVSREIWAGKFIQSLEHQSQTNDIVGEILDRSIEDRILSLYTAFICLEPSLGGQVCYDCFDESEMVSVEDDLNTTDSDSTLIIAYPNPFNAQTKIQIKLGNLKSGQTIDLKIYNILGALVRDFNISYHTIQNNMEVIWDGRNDAGVSVASGTYLLVLSTPELKKSHKLLLMR